MTTGSPLGSTAAAAVAEVLVPELVSELLLLEHAVAMIATAHAHATSGPVPRLDMRPPGDVSADST
jgi:hypothetical protein